MSGASRMRSGTWGMWRIVFFTELAGVLHELYNTRRLFWYPTKWNENQSHVCIPCHLARFDEFIFQVHHITGYHMCLYLLVKTLIVPSGALGAFVLYDIILLLEMSVPLRFSLITFWYSFCEGLNKLSVSPPLALSVVILKCPSSNCVALRFGMNLSPPLGVLGALDPPGVLAWSIITDVFFNSHCFNCINTILCTE